MDIVSSTSQGRGRRIRAVGLVTLVSTGITSLGVLGPPAAHAATPSFRVVDTTVAETGADHAVCTRVQLSRTPKRRTTVDFRTVDGSATAPSDYVAKSGTLVFRKGAARTRNVCTTLRGDLLNEPTERFSVKLSGAAGARIRDRVGEVTVTDDDAAPALTVGDAATVTEGGSGVRAMTFPVSLSSPSAQPVTVGYSFGPGAPAATADVDFTVSPQSGTLTFAPGDQAEQLSVQVIGDSVDEVDERVALSLANAVNATIADGHGAGTIRDDDGPGIAIGNVSRNEGWQDSPMVFDVTLSAPSPQPVTVAYATANGSATGGSDFAHQSGTLTFAPGQTARTVSVVGFGDLGVEGTETFSVNLSAPTNATVADGQGVGTLFNDDYTSTDEGIGGAATLGTVSGDTGSGQATRFDSILLGDADWYRVELTENNTDIFSSRALTARVSLQVGDGPSQTTGDLDLRVYRADGTLVGGSFAGGTGDEVFDVKKSDGLFVLDHTHFYVRVYGFGDQQINNYVLRVDGNVATGVGPNLG